LKASTSPLFVSRRASLALSAAMFLVSAYIAQWPDSEIQAIKKLKRDAQAR
jgi:hypothetical protein